MNRYCAGVLSMSSNVIDVHGWTVHGVLTWLYEEVTTAIAAGDMAGRMELVHGWGSSGHGGTIADALG